MLWEIKNGVKKCLNKLPSAYPSSRVTYKQTNVESELDEINSNLSSLIYHQSFAIGLTAQGDQELDLENLWAPSSQYKTFIPTGYLPQNSWDTQIIFKRYEPSTTKLYFRVQGADTQGYTIYGVFIK